MSSPSSPDSPPATASSTAPPLSSAAPAIRAASILKHPAFLEFRPELFGGLNGAAIGLVITLAASALVFAPVGAQYLASGIIAGLVAAVIGNVVVSALVKARPSASGPRASSCLVLAGFVGSISAASPSLGIGALIALTSGCIMMAGAIQLIFGLLRLGSLMRFVPFPVVSGFTNGIAIILFIGFAPLVFGIANHPAAGISEFVSPRWGAFAIGVITLVTIIVAERRTKAVPSSFIGLVIGVLVYAFMALLLPSVDAGEVVGSGSKSAMDSALGSVILVPWSEAANAVRAQPVLWKFLLGYALVLAFIGSLDSMLATLQIEGHTHQRYDPNRELIAHGVANIVSAALGGLAVASSTSQLQAMYRAGGRTMSAGLVQSAVLLIALVTSPIWLRHMPLALLGALMLAAAYKLADPWARDLFAEFWKKRRRDDDVTQSLAVVVLVAGFTVATDFVTAIIVGLIVSGAIYVRAVNNGVIRSVLTGRAASSRHMYDATTVEYLETALGRAAVVQLEGQLFFGTAERVANALDRLPAGIQYIVLDFQRVHGLDASSAIVLQRTQRRLKSLGKTLVFAQMQKRDFDQKLRELAGSRGGESSRIFPDADRAMEWVERQLIAEQHNDSQFSQRVDDDFSIFARMTPAEKAIVRNYLQELEAQSGDVLFEQDDAGRELYLLREGMVGIYQGSKNENGLRLVSFAAGTMFGEMALLDRRPRAATGICDGPCSLYVLTRDSLDNIERDAPLAAAKIYEAIAHDVSQRLRATNILLTHEMA